MDLKKMKQITELMKRSDLTEFEIEEKDYKLRICRHHAPVNHRAPQAVASPPVPAPLAEDSKPQAPAEDNDATIIKSPMVGTFFAASSPDTEAFVTPGSSVQPDSIVCIVEAMKVMNEIHAEVKGTITEVLVENGETIEYGQALFKVK